MLACIDDAKQNNARSLLLGTTLVHNSSGAPPLTGWADALKPW